MHRGVGKGLIYPAFEGKSRNRIHRIVRRAATRGMWYDAIPKPAHRVFTGELETEDA